MNLTLKRGDADIDGVFSQLTSDDSGKLIAMTLEHAYPQEDGSYAPKIQPGTYTCVRSLHQLHNMERPFITFEITGVTGHTNILFHVGNFNEDSEGCVLLGEYITRSATGVQMLTNSRVTFEKFMSFQENVTSFTLTVK
jgi:hypothetical protein